MTVITIFVSDMDRAVRFYAEALGMKLEYRFGNDWASLKTEDGVTIGLHPASKESPAGKKGSITIGFEASGSIEQTVARMKQKGVSFLGPIVDDREIKAAYFEDPDGNQMYVVETQKDWQEFSQKQATG